MILFLLYVLRQFYFGWNIDAQQKSGHHLLCIKMVQNTKELFLNQYFKVHIPYARHYNPLLTYLYVKSKKVDVLKHFVAFKEYINFIYHDQIFSNCNVLQLL